MILCDGRGFFKAGGTTELKMKSFRPGIVIIIPGLFLCAASFTEKKGLIG